MKNTFEIRGKVVVIHAYGIGKSHEISVDWADIPLVASIPGTWGVVLLGGHLYAAYDLRIGKKKTKLLMHRMLMNPLPGFVIDHFDHDGLNNRRKNLRVVTHQQNILHRKPTGNRGNSSGTIGVRFERGKWRAKIGANGKTKHLGSFETKEDAAMAYDTALKTIMGIRG